MKETSLHPRKIAPSILAADHSALRQAVETVRSQPVEWLHIDIMDGRFVPNLSFGPKTVADLRETGKGLFFDTHLMLARPDLLVDAFAEAGSDQITIHTEPFYPVGETLRRIRGHGLKTGLALNPDTPLHRAHSFLEEIDILLLMTVQPGFGGQSFRRDVLPKIGEAAHLRESHGLSFRIEVDGGVDAGTAPLCAQAGADTFVCGTAYFRADDKKAFQEQVEGSATSA